MARIESQLLFLTTSPRTPEKMIPEISLLTDKFSGEKWDNGTQKAFMESLREEDYFHGKGVNDPAFSARDRINRAPKSLGFVELTPQIRLTPAGKNLLKSKRKDEVFLRQMLKFQIPSPYHKPTAEAAKFCVKPYLEMLRLVRTMGTLKFDELQIFGMQLTDYHDFDEIVRKIEKFRVAKAEHKGSYRVIKTVIKKEFYDGPLMLEWNTWRAMTMLDGGKIKANLNFDDYGQPLSTASGNMADIVCDYGDYMVCVEVTMASGQRQFEMEGEPVTRHLGKLKVASGKPCYCLFVAPTINEASVSFFFTLHKTNLAMYGGKSTIIPLPLQVFRKMVEDSYKASYTPNPVHVRKFFEASNAIADSSENEVVWYEKIKEKALRWLE